jgi:tripartite-type tricarboxylate transporter receptor subunit TctC
MMMHTAYATGIKNFTLQTAQAVQSVIFFVMLCSVGSAFAQARDSASYPDRPIKIVVGFVPGGPTDLYARVAARGLSDVLGQQVVVENKPGASGAIAATAVAGAVADGYTLLAHVVSDIITPIANKKVGYNLERDFTAIGLIASAPNVLVVHPSIPANSVQELIAYAKKNPNTLNYGSAGVGTVSHLAGALLEAEAQTPLAHIQYKGTNGAQLDLLAGRITVMFDNLGNGLSNAQAGKLKALAVTSVEPWAAAATIPTMVQSGFPGSTILSVFGLVAPVGTPVGVVNKLSAALSQGLRTEAYRKSIIDSGAQPGDLAAEAYAKYIAAESRRWESFLAQHPEIMKQ